MAPQRQILKHKGDRHVGAASGNRIALAGQIIAIPPLISITSPVMNDAAGEVR